VVQHTNERKTGVRATFRFNLATFVKPNNGAFVLLVRKCRSRLTPLSKRSHMYLKKQSVGTNLSSDRVVDSRTDYKASSCLEYCTSSKTTARVAHVSATVKPVRACQKTRSTSFSLAKNNNKDIVEVALISSKSD